MTKSEIMELRQTRFGLVTVIGDRVEMSKENFERMAAYGNAALAEVMAQESVELRDGKASALMERDKNKRIIYWGQLGFPVYEDMARKSFCVIPFEIACKLIDADKALTSLHSAPKPEPVPHPLDAIIALSERMEHEPVIFHGTVEDGNLTVLKVVFPAGELYVRL